MPFLDVSDVLLDPMFCDEIHVIRRSEAVNDSGINETTETSLYPIGVITQGSPPSVNIEPDAQHAKGAITVHCVMRLYDVTQSYLPDLVVFNGNRYTVERAYNWSNYGAGFFAADCELVPLVSAQ
jgi:hypothetical protein